MNKKKTFTVALGLDMQFRSSKTRLLIAILNIVTQLCDENIETLLHQIYLKWKSQHLVSELLDSTYIGSPKYAGVYLEISLLDCLTTKKCQDFPGLFQNFRKIRGLFRTLQIPGLSRTAGNHSLNGKPQNHKNKNAEERWIASPTPQANAFPKM